MEIWGRVVWVGCSCTCPWGFSHQDMSDSCNPIDCCPPGSSVHGTSQARILEWVAVSFSRGSSWPSNETHVSCRLSPALQADSSPTEPLGKPAPWGPHILIPQLSPVWLPQAPHLEQCLTLAFSKQQFPPYIVLCRLNRPLILNV